MLSPTFLPAHSPVPDAGTFIPASMQLRLHFDGPLTAGPLSAGNWTMNHGGFLLTCVVIVAGAPGPNYVQGTFVNSGTSGKPPGTRVYYDPPPFDLLSAAGVPAKRIDGFTIP